MFLLNLFIASYLLFSNYTYAHSIDAGALNIQVQENRIAFELQLNSKSVEAFMKDTKPDDLFTNTLQTSQITLNNQKCDWRSPTLENFLDGEQNLNYKLSVVAVCDLPVVETQSMEITLPFLNTFPDSYKLLTSVTGLTPQEQNYILNNKKQVVLINSKAQSRLSLFVLMGLEHIGAHHNQWINDNSLQLPEGLDHILYVMALVLTATSLLAVIGNATGFTIGHTLTLALSTFKIIHVHSHWVEAFIALSISLLMLLYFIKPKFQHGFTLNIVLGTVHGLGFASVIHDLQMPTDKVLPTLLAFNVGVEIGQIIFILIFSLLFYLLKKTSDKLYKYSSKVIAAAVFVLSFYWFVDRAFI